MKDYAMGFVLLLLLLVGSHVNAVNYQLPDLDGQTQSLDQYREK